MSESVLYNFLADGDQVMLTYSLRVSGEYYYCTLMVSGEYLYICSITFLADGAWLC